MYTLYIPKYQGDRTPFEITQVLNDYMKAINYHADIIAAPGYLSKKTTSADDFITQLEVDVTAGAHDVYIGWFSGVNGGTNITGIGGVGSILDYHRNYVTTTGKLHNMPITCKSKKDHRKMMFFFKNDSWDYTQTLDLSTLNEFLKDVAVYAVLIGSSNQSLNTYYNPTHVADKGEADILLFTDDFSRTGVGKGASKVSVLASVLDYDAIGEVFVPNLSKKIEDNESQMILSSSIACRSSDRDYLKAILKEFLEKNLTT